MIEDPVTYWQGITETYRQMSDGELCELAANLGDFTDVAQQVLRDEMRKRGLGQRPSPFRSAPAGEVARKNFDPLANPLADTYVVPSGPSEASQEDEFGADYTWKTLLCECSEPIEAMELAEVLKRAGIDCWVEALPSHSIGVGSPRVLVAADQLEEARAIAAHPIPPDIVEFFKTEVPEFELPACPKCGAGEPTLEATEPANLWSCESCGAEWSEPEEPSSNAKSDGRKFVP